MKKSLSIIILLFLFICQGNSQDFEVGFSGGEAVIDSVIATNLSTRESVKIPGGASLVLRNSATGIKTFYSDEEGLTVVYPGNENVAILNYQTKEAGKVNVQFYEINGRIRAQNRFQVTSGINQIKVSAKNQGIYLVKIQDGTNTYTDKMVLKGRGNDHIDYMGNSGLESFNGHEKSLVEPPYVLLFSEGDIISYAFYSGIWKTIINEAAGISAEIIPEFYECVDNGGKSYGAVKIGKQVWMAENLAYDTGSGCWAYEDQDSNIVNYGRLYTWEVAMDGAASNNSFPGKVQGICPEGWHLPSHAEWDTLGHYVRSLFLNLYPDKTDHYAPLGNDLKGVGTHLKTTVGWAKNGNMDGNGTDDFGFSGRPGGYTGNGFFDAEGKTGLWWSSTESSSTYAWYMSLHFDADRFRRMKIKKESGLCVRCVKD